MRLMLLLRWCRAHPANGGEKIFLFHQIISIYSFTISFPAACQPIKPELSSIT